MDKKYFFLIAAALGLIIVFLLIGIMIVQQRKFELANPIPTAAPTPSPTPIFDTRPTSKPTIEAGTPLAVDSTIPANGATNVFLDTDITIKFNRIFELNDFIFAVTPSFKYQSSYDRGKFEAYIIPDKPLQPNTKYTFKVNTLKQLPITVMFTTGEATGAAKIKF